MKGLFALFSCFIFVSSYGQIIIRGHVRDYKSHEGIPDAEVSATALERNSYFTDRNGYFELSLRKPVQYGQSVRLLITAKGYLGWDEVIPVSILSIEYISLTKKRLKVDNKQKPKKKTNSIPLVTLKVPLAKKKWQEPIEQTFHVASMLDTKIDIVLGDSIEILTTGFISLSEQFPHVNSTGLKSSNHSLEDKYNIARDLNYGALIAKVGNGEWLPCGYFRSGIAAHEGRIMLAINDTVLGDNDGFFDVKIIVFHIMK